MYYREIGNCCKHLFIKKKSCQVGDYMITLLGYAGKCRGNVGEKYLTIFKR